MVTILVPMEFGNLVGMTAAFLYPWSSALITSSAWGFIWGVPKMEVSQITIGFNTEKRQNSFMIWMIGGNVGKTMFRTSNHPGLGMVNPTYVWWLDGIVSTKPGIFHKFWAPPCPAEWAGMVGDGASSLVCCFGLASRILRGLFGWVILTWS